ncbi:MAG: serine/threonine-protein kinase, partial [Planctomycetota bacterium]|nr:serine/threonine-protein kinase [Planctomycetota bacterium]
MTSSASPEDQQFLALLTSRRFISREQALQILEGCTESDFSQVLATVSGFSSEDIKHLRQTRAMREPRIPGYKIEKLLGMGGTAEVYAAQRERDFERVALKVLRPDLSRDKVAATQFVKEAKLLQELDVQQVVKGHRIFRFMHSLVLEMERVAGQTLLEWIDQGRSFSEGEALDIICEVAIALEGMREHDVIHRDLKPSNIMLDRDFNVKVIDLGFAGAGLEGSHGEGTTMGTAAYLAPEQAKGQSDLDGRADIYSLGVTLYHLVLGELPFVASDDAELLRMQVLNSLKGAAMKGGKVSPMVHYFLEKMMAKDRDVRYS